MGLWSAYFFAKILLYALGYMDFTPWMNLALAVFTALIPRNSRQRFAKNLIAVPLAVLLLYHDSYLPPITQALSQAQNLRSFSGQYLLELAGRLISVKLLAELAVMFVLYALARRKLRLSTFVFLGIFAIMLVPHSRWWALPAAAQTTATANTASRPPDEEPDLRPEALDARLEQFYSAQRKAQVRFARPPAEDAAFDILILHVCSLSWDDLKTLKISPDSVFGRFDIVMSNVSSAASYSGPAAIRLLRGACGQTSERQLYDAPRSECLVIDGLQAAGFEPHWVMNHDGHFGNFFADVHDRGGLSVALEDTSGATVGAQAFDGTRVLSDYSVLSRWWTKRLKNPAARVALYYNTISLHDGNRVISDGRNDSSYGARFAQFTSDIARFMDDLRRSGRHVIVVFIAEHGAALSGDRRQIAGLREIPTRAISHVPVAFALINAPRSAIQAKVDLPASYPAVNELLSRFIAADPFDKSDLNLADYTTALPQTDFVAENNATTVIEIGNRYMMRSPDGAWSRLD
jgi:cellulose synthase operon protein YhjU